MDVIKQMPKQRQSNFELLRIVSMMLVLLCHYVPTRDFGVAIVSFVLIYLFCTLIDQIRIWVYNRWVVACGVYRRGGCA